MTEFLDIEVVKIILDDASWMHPDFEEWEEVMRRAFRFKYRNGKGETLTVFFNSFELCDLLKDEPLQETSAEIIADMVVYQMVGDFWIPSSPMRELDTDPSKVFSLSMEGQVVTQFFAKNPIGLMEWS